MREESLPWTRPARRFELLPALRTALTSSTSISSPSAMFGISDGRATPWEMGACWRGVFCGVGAVIPPDAGELMGTLEDIADARCLSSPPLSSSLSSSSMATMNDEGERRKGARALCAGQRAERVLRPDCHVTSRTFAEEVSPLLILSLSLGGLCG